MYSFRNDYSQGAHPRLLELLREINFEQNAGYGEDKHCENAKKLIKSKLKNDDVDVHFISGGTQTNLIAISSFLRPHQCVISADTAHINTHETGAVEATGHKVVTVSSPDGKVTSELIEEVIEAHPNEHNVQPKLVYISNSTEVGTIYTKTELAKISETCRNNDLLLYLDGARLASALTSRKSDLTLADISRLVDAFYIGGTKNGALLGEALVICNDELKRDFRYYIKQRGGLMAKGFVMGVQFEGLFEGDLFFKLGEHANEMAEMLATSIEECGYEFYAPPCTNQLFPIVPNDLLSELSKEFTYSVQEKVDEDHVVIRLVTSWATSLESVKALSDFFRKFSKK